jgi:hypothetical protein
MARNSQRYGTDMTITAVPAQIWRLAAQRLNERQYGAICWLGSAGGCNEYGNVSNVTALAIANQQITANKRI